MDNDTQYQGVKKDVEGKEVVKTRKAQYDLEASKKEDRSLSQHDLIIQKFGSWKNYLDITNWANNTITYFNQAATGTEATPFSAAVS